MQGREFAGGMGYRWGFGSMEKDLLEADETFAFNFGFRLFDVRIARWFSVDPAKDLYADYSPYLFAGCNPVLFMDIDGRDFILTGHSVEFAKFKNVIEAKYNHAVVIQRNSENVVTMAFNENTIQLMANQQNTNSEKIKEMLNMEPGIKALNDIMQLNGKITEAHLAETVNEKNSILLGKWGWIQDLDMDDIKVLDEYPGSGGAFGAVVHEIWEAYDYQVIHNRYIDPVKSEVPGELSLEAQYLPSHEAAEIKQAQILGVSGVKHTKSSANFSVSISITESIDASNQKTTTYTWDVDTRSSKVQNIVPGTGSKSEPIVSRKPQNR
jgi:RHS repeat-associated protein